MSHRTDNLPANQLMTRIQRLQTNLQQLKQAQTAGSTSVLLTRNATGNSPDFTINSTYHVINIWEITFTPDNQSFPNTGFIWHFFADEGTAGPNTLLELEQTPTQQNVRYIYAMGITSGSSDSISITIVIYSIGGGTISIEQIQ